MSISLFTATTFFTLLNELFVIIMQFSAHCYLNCIVDNMSLNEDVQAVNARSDCWTELLIMQIINRYIITYLPVMRVEVLMAVYVQIVIFQDVTQCSLIGRYQCFWVICIPNLSWRWRQQVSSEWTIYQSKWHHITGTVIWPFIQCQCFFLSCSYQIGTYIWWGLCGCNVAYSGLGNPCTCTYPYNLF